ncbi:rhomboid family intramembrane serine protease [Inconstantimicrobium mannanitabidum]|uniref:Membrane associated peptidase n=1 Tax=Inconstantimicrobium mannanitabidum TaxID=1604901 RepID=A0ACB5RDX9_9CLOT|nr:rhomboid family intramembrane serine protease [Clostridium sp. TW13]GKX66961.1 membrane associated peptidase [Clostridium sp. TW13]
MEAIEERLFKTLINNYGFFVEQYECNGKLNWMALGNTNTGICAVIVSSASMEETNAYYANVYLKAKNISYTVHNIIITEGSYEKSREGNNYEKLVYSKSEDTILFYSSSTEPIAKIFQSVRNNKVSMRNTDKSYFSITNILIGLNVIMFIVSVLISGQIFDIDTDVLIILGAKVNYLIDQGQIYRLVTAMFLHGGLMHIAFNMYALYALGDFIERIYGKIGYLVIYFVSGIAANLLSYMLSPNYASMGASGAIFGLFGAALVFGIKERDKIGKDFLINIGSVVAINVFIGMSQRDIDNAAHFGGFIGGIVVAFIIRELKLSKAKQG